MAGRGKVVVSRRVDFPPEKHWFSRWKYRQPDRIIAISDRIARVLLDFGFDRDKVAVVHSGIDPARLEVDPLPRRELGVPEEVPLLGNVAALVDHKDHATLLAAMPHVLHDLPNLHLVIAGEGELRPQLEAQIHRLNLGGAVHVLGYRKDVPRLLRALDAFVLSSKLEGLGTSILDAMACGLPVVATAAGGIPEMVVHEQTGLLVPAQQPEALAAAVVRIFRDCEEARKLAQAGKELVHRRFTVERMVEGNLRVYESLL
jgi:glycosyltransferase involved in cell wall biosynthesis